MRGPTPNPESQSVRPKQAGNLDVVGTLLNGNASVDIPNVWGRTPLHKACEAGNVSLILQVLCSLITWGEITISTRFFRCRGNQFSGMGGLGISSVV